MLPELQNSQFSLLGGRVTYLEQTPGAHLIYTVRKHDISVFIFPEGTLGIKDRLNLAVTGKLSFRIATRTQNGLRCFVIGDASPADIDRLANLFKTTNS